MTAQTTFRFGLVHAPVTPFRERAIDYPTFGRVLDFQIAHGAEGLAIQTHSGESVSLTVPERKAILEFAIEKVAGRVPVVAHVSEAGTSIAADLAGHARAAGAAAVMACVPYYWTPPDPMLVEHFAQIGEAAKLPLYLYNAPSEMAGVKIKTAVVLALIERLPNLAGVIDCSMDWQFMIDVIASAQRARPSFELVSGTEYMVSAHATGATGFLSPLANVAPRLVRSLYDRVKVEDYKGAYDAQVQAALLHRVIHPHGVPALKMAAREMGRDPGPVRPPLVGLNADGSADLARELKALPALASEPRGW